MEEQKEVLLKRNKYMRCVSRTDDEFRLIRSYLRYLCVDQSNIYTAGLSWSMFFLFALIVPSVSHFTLACETCDATHVRPYDGIVQLSLSSVATLSFFCLSRFVSKYGLRRFLFFDKLVNESETVKAQYTEHVNKSIKFLSTFVLPCFLAETAYKIWWYASGGTQIPFLGNVYVSDAVACIMELCSWFYRTTIIFLVCVLFYLLCQLQILRLQDFASNFHMQSDVGSVLSEHLRIRRHLRIISHRYRDFIVLILLLVTGSQFASLLMTTKSKDYINIYRAGELALCSITLLTALLIILQSATKITHKAQAVTSIAAKWHVCATVESFEAAESDTPTLDNRVFPNVGTDGESDGDDDAGDKDELDNQK